MSNTENSMDLVLDVNFIPDLKMAIFYMYSRRAFNYSSDTTYVLNLDKDIPSFRPQDFISNHGGGGASPSIKIMYTNIAWLSNRSISIINSVEGSNGYNIRCSGVLCLN